MICVALYLCDASFVSPIAWLANRCTLVCAAFGFAAIFVHLERRQPEPSTPSWLLRAGLGLECALLVGSMAAGEYGLGVVALLFALEAFGSSDPWPARARALLPAFAVAFVYLCIHSLGDYGTFGADVYADPLHSPRGWLKWLGLRLPMLAA